MADEFGISVRYFAAAVDAAGCRGEIIALSPTTELGDLKSELIAKYGADMKRVLSVSAFLVAGELTRDLRQVIGSEVDVLPPFAGG